MNRQAGQELAIRANGLLGHVGHHVELLQQRDLVSDRVEEVGNELFRELDSGDVLFIDSSHVIRPGGDVLF
jgi:hypothetical protein